MNLAVLFFTPYPGFENVDAERILWSFGYDCGLTHVAFAQD